MPFLGHRSAVLFPVPVPVQLIGFRCHCHFQLSSALVVTFVCPAFIFRLHCVEFVCTTPVEKEAYGAVGIMPSSRAKKFPASPDEEPPYTKSTPNFLGYFLFFWIPRELLSRGELIFNPPYKVLEGILNGLLGPPTKFTTLRIKSATIIHTSYCSSSSIAPNNLRVAFWPSINPFTCVIFIRS